MGAITTQAGLARPSRTHPLRTRDTTCRGLRAVPLGQLTHGKAIPIRSVQVIRPMRGVAMRANWNDDTEVKDRAEKVAEKTQAKKDNEIIAGGVVVLMASALLAMTVGQDAIEDIMYGTGQYTALGVFGSGDLVGALLWSFSLWFCSPLQLLFLFLGQIETERPSDWLILQFGKLSGQPLESVDYSAPMSLRVAAGASCALAGLVIAASLELGLGDATWSVSTGIGSILVSGIYEVGRPKRLNAEEAEELQGQWEDFAVFAGTRLQKGGRCHESEVFKAFRKSNARYRDPAVMTDMVLRDMVRNWHPAVQRTNSGYYKNVSLVPVADPFQ